MDLDPTAMMGPMTPDEPRRRLGWLVAERRKALGLSKDAAARVADINRMTWRQVEDKHGVVRDITYAAIERGLSWEPGSIGSILEGGLPRLLADVSPVAALSHAESVNVPVATKMLEMIRAEYGEAVYQAALEEVDRSQDEGGSQQNRQSAT